MQSNRISFKKKMIYLPKKKKPTHLRPQKNPYIHRFGYFVPFPLAVVFTRQKNIQTSKLILSDLSVFNSFIE